MKAPKEWSVYLVRCADASLYTGIAKDVAARVAAHNDGRGAAYTRSRLPVRLVYQKKGFTRSTASVEEARIKSLERPAKLALVARSLRRAAGALALLWAAASPASALPVFVPENTIVLSSAAPQAFTGESTYAPLRMYYLPAVSSGVPHTSSGAAVLSATSVNGFAWTKESGVRVDTNTVPSVSASSITGCSLQPLTAGGFRMLYSIVSTTGAYRIHSATSADGLAWANETATHVDAGTIAFVAHPKLVVLNSGDWRMFYVSGSTTTPADRVIRTARSTDQGASWGSFAVALSTLAYEVGASKLADGKIRLYYTQALAAGSSATVIASALSSDALGTSFTQESGFRVSTTAATGALAFPVPARSTDSFRWRLYYAAYEAFNSTGDARSALTGAPAPVSISPNTVYASAGSIPITISGEVFSTGPSVSITRGATTIAGTSVNRSNDQTITANFATQGQAVGTWDVTVTNADGVATTVSNLLTIDFAPGVVVLTNNLLRPRLGGSTTIDITTFNPGPVTARVYDLEGRPVNTLFEGFQPAGAFTVTWNGRSASGAAAPSGVYFVQVTGPKINQKSKIVLIR